MLSGMSRRLGLAGLLAAGALAPTLAAPQPAQAATFKWANDGDANSMDPYTRSETFLLTFTQNIYDPLVRRDRNLKVEPALAESWESPTPRPGASTCATASSSRAASPSPPTTWCSATSAPPARAARSIGYFQAVKEVKKVDDFTVDFVTKVPDPIFLEEITGWVIMSKAWCEAHNAVQPSTSPRSTRTSPPGTPTAPARSSWTCASPTGAPRMHANPDWWDKLEATSTDVSSTSSATPRPGWRPCCRATWT